MKRSFILFAYFSAAVAAGSCSPPQVRAPGGNQGGAPGSRDAGGGRGGSAAPAPSSTGGTSGFVLPDAAPATPPPPPAGPTEGMNCGLDKIQLRSQPGQLLLILDRSGSMAQVVGPTQPIEKWGEVVKALDAVVSRTQASIAWGLKLYPMGSVCGVPDGLTVPMAADNHQAIMAAIAANRPIIDGGATPTREAILKAMQDLKNVPSGMAPHLLVATDGIPNCTTMTAGNPPDPAGAIEAVQLAHAAGIPAYVVGIATAGTDADTTLNSMAMAGGRPRNDATKYYPVASRDELMAAFTTISGQVASCTFPLTRRPPVPDNVAVDVGGQRISQDPTMTGGWYYGPNQESITLAGAPCDQVKQGTTDVKIIFGCPDQVIP
jgi:hypothetical protein